ncbi:ABC transporter ATP-binding protein [Veillonella criceti]|uniref:Maltose/maltodextrin import ATP-binding protein MalK n=1 Tax=Veillonella criceti TaxID=103891 RepID=A0A380NLA1_9FIRM|nr:ABC transporter ATP-binding protein [Veillonella criceti]SUP43893.1 Maltose/maltodextrin import ATP-binding protein MalK [Veillonella criceti]
MHNIVFDTVTKSYHGKEIIKQLNFEIKEGERVVLLGPSGSGKSTTLRMIAGLETITSGQLFMGNTCVNDIPPGDRNIAMVFQNYALFPHFNVWDNIVFGLKLQKLPQSEIELRTKAAIDMLNLTGYEHRLIQSLSGGQKQRVALCRAIVKQSPYFLLDEPLANLDAQLRQHARQELIKIHESCNSTMIYVTHDQIEAMTIGQRIAILHEGILQQFGNPQEVYNQPANTFVASFIGTPAMNLWELPVTNGQLHLGSTTLDLPDTITDNSIILGIRPEKLKIVPSETALLHGKCQYIENIGHIQNCLLDFSNDLKGFIQIPSMNAQVQLDEQLGITFNLADACFFDSQTKQNLQYKLTH